MNELIEIFPWDENFATGIPQIDEQHKRLIHLLNTLASSLAHRAEAPILNNIFNELANYAVYHFQTEEAVWHQYFPDDPWELAHKKSHESFVDDVLRLRNEENGKSQHEVLEDVLSFLTHWLAFHILENDKRMAKVALAVQSGLTLQEAKLEAEQQMSGAVKVLIETVLAMYDSLSTRTLQLMKEVIDRQNAEAKLRLAANAVENTLESICITDVNANIIDANPAFYQTTLFAPEEVIGRNLKTIKSGFEDKKLSSKIWATVAEKGHWSGEIKSRTNSGELYTDWLTLSVIRDEHGAISNYVGVFSNIAHLAQQWHELEHIANHDALTDLPNRLLLSDRLELALAHAERTGNFIAICFLDLDGFKPVNDEFGHAAGDLVLQEIAKRLLKVVRGSDTVSRVGGDEFVMLLANLNSLGNLKEMLDRVLEEIAHPIQIQNQKAYISGSIGVTLFPQDHSDAETLLQHADQAMYQAKHMGKAGYYFYDPTL